MYTNDSRQPINDWLYCLNFAARSCRICMGVLTGPDLGVGRYGKKHACSGASSCYGGSAQLSFKAN